mgnify:CR=1 FL=1
MSIGFILLLVLNAFLFFNYIDDLTHLGDIINRISCKLNATIDLVDSLNRRVEVLEKELNHDKD